jgi:hypothetical protein
MKHNSLEDTRKCYFKAVFGYILFPFEFFIGEMGFSWERDVILEACCRIPPL